MWDTHTHTHTGVSVHAIQYVHKSIAQNMCCEHFVSVCSETAVVFACQYVKERKQNVCFTVCVGLHCVHIYIALLSSLFCFVILFVWLDINTCVIKVSAMSPSLCVHVCFHVCLSSRPDTPPRAFEANIDRGRAVDCYTHGHTHRFRENSRWDCGKRWLQTQTRCSRPNTDQNISLISESAVSLTATLPLKFLMVYISGLVYMKRYSGPEMVMNI